jgi:hypothetical protein
MLAEKNPELFTGALCIGGPLGGAKMEVEYIYNVRILFDRFFRFNGQALLPALSPPAQALGDGALDAHPVAGLPADGTAFVTEVAPLLFALFESYPSEATAMSTTTVGGDLVFNCADTMEFAITVAGALWYNIFGTEDILGRTHGHVPIDNADVEYRVGDQVLDNVERLSLTRDAENYLKHWYQPTGELSIPVGILHTERDPIVPFAHALAYAGLAAASGNVTLVSIFGTFGHCQILFPLERVTEFGGWVLIALNSLVEGTGAPTLLP